MKNLLPRLGTSTKAASQRGLTMVELLVAMVLMGLVTLATVSLYTVASQTSKTVDSTQELNDSARYAFEIIGQALRVAGYEDYMPNNPDIPKVAGSVYPAVCTSAAPPCPVIGFNNSTVASVGSVTDFGATNNGGYNGSDTLGVTFSGVSLPSNTAAPDGTVVDCQGVPQGAMMTSTSLGLSLFYVSTAGTEPELSCIGSARNSQPVIRGVESLQVVYGIDASVGGSLTTSSIPNRWVSAQDVPDWNRVRAVRVGLVLRGAPGTSQAQQAGSNDLYPLGEDFSAGNTEAGIKFTPPADGRLRRAFAATFMLRNRL